MKFETAIKFVIVTLIINMIFITTGSFLSAWMDSLHTEMLRYNLVRHNNLVNMIVANDQIIIDALIQHQERLDDMPPMFSLVETTQQTVVQVVDIDSAVLKVKENSQEIKAEVIAAAKKDIRWFSGFVLSGFGILATGFVGIVGILAWKKL